MPYKTKNYITCEAMARWHKATGAKGFRKQRTDKNKKRLKKVIY